MEVKTISVDRFKTIFNVPNIDLVKLGLFTEEDTKEIFYIFGIQDLTTKIWHLIFKEFASFIRNPLKLLLNFRRIFAEQFSGVSKHYRGRSKELSQRYPISDYNLKASVIAAFKPQVLLEIGTWFGWGIAAMKTAVPDCDCYTLNTKETAEVNNPLLYSEVGGFYRKKNLQITQLWGDSKKFDFSTLAKNIDVCYLDGCHEYDYVISDLTNCSEICQKAVILDDYIPSPLSSRGDVISWGWWNADVVRAVGDFLKANPKSFREAYWLEATPICILVK